MNKNNEYKKIKNHWGREPEIQRAAEKELKRQITTMPTLKTLSLDILNFKKTYKLIHKKADNRTVLNAYKKHMIKVDEDALLNEIEKFIESLSLSIMQRNLNSKKGSRV